MKPILVMITGSEHPWFTEGDVVDFLAFEHLAMTAATYYETELTPTLSTLQHAENELQPGCVDVTVYFTGNNCMELHLHPYMGGGDFGIYDVIGDLMVSSDASPLTQTKLAEVVRTIH